MKGEESTARTMYIVFGIISLLLVFTVGLSIAGNVEYGSCWQKTIDQLKSLEKHENRIDMDEKCVESVVITQDKEKLKEFGCTISNPEKKYESFFVVFPVEPPSGWGYFEDPVVTWQGRNRVIKCFGSDFFPIKGEIVLSSLRTECLYIEYDTVKGKDTIREC